MGRIDARVMAGRLREVVADEPKAFAYEIGVSLSALYNYLNGRIPSTEVLFRIACYTAQGSNWEAAMAAAHYRLDNLTAILDHNTLQITGRTREVCSNEPLDEKYRAFGWTVRTVNVHDPSELTAALNESPGKGQPSCVIANTVKGKGVTFMEDVAKWHHWVPSEQEFRQRLAAILAADASGYSRLMAADERATVTVLDNARAVFRRQIESNQGRVIDTAGDSVLAVFETATGAVSSALAIQTTDDFVR